MAIPQPPDYDPVDLPQDPGLFGGWGQKLEQTLTRFALRVWNATYGRAYRAGQNTRDYFLEKTAERVRPMLLPYLDKLDAIPGMPPEIKTSIQQLRGTEPITLTAIAIACIMGLIVGAIMGMAQPFMRLLAQEVDSYVHSARMTPTEAFASLKRGLISPADYHNHLSDGGWSEELEVVWSQLLAPLISVGDLSTLFLRGEMGEGEFDKGLDKRGYNPEEKGQIKTLLKIIPPLPDIIRMAVREAFTPDIVQQFQLHAELPGDMVTWAAKQGLSREWAEAYWASHWQLPSLLMGYEMLHRGEIDEGEMAMLVKAHDVSPFWRDKLINISYNPYTRVDVRRMHSVGVLNTEGVYRSYRDLGYDHEKATKMTEFTVALNQGTERDLTKTDVLYGYDVGYFSPTETDDLLILLGYDKAEAAFYRAKVDFKRWQKAVKEQVKYIEQRYVMRQIEQSEVYAELGKLNLPSEQMNRYILAWDVKRAAKVKRLTAAKLTEFRELEVITDSEFSIEMAGLGYNDRYISWYLRAIGIEREE